MNKVAVIYWSGTGNTEAMANEAPDDNALAACRALGAELVK